MRLRGDLRLLAAQRCVGRDEKREARGGAREKDAFPPADFPAQARHLAAAALADVEACRAAADPAVANVAAFAAGLRFTSPGGAKAKAIAKAAAAGWAPAPAAA